MQVLIFATYNEAKPIIKKLNLQSHRAFNRDCFTNYRKDMYLFISGIGRKSAYECTCNICKNFPKDIQIINIGTCASANMDKLILASKISSNKDAKIYYPDILINYKNVANLKEIKTITDIANTNLVLQNQSVAYDMEAYYIYKAAADYLGPNNISFIKIAHDTGIDNIISEDNNSSYNKSNIKQRFKLSTNYAIESKTKEICNLLKILKKQVYSSNSYTRIKNNTTAKKINEIKQSYDVGLIAANLKCSAYMKNRLEKQLYFAEICKIDINRMINNVTNNHKLPLEHKKTGCQILDAIDDYLEKNSSL